MNAKLKQQILLETQATDATEMGVVQELWGGYGEILRVRLTDANSPSIIVKDIRFPEIQNHPRGWNTSASHARKVKSYAVEINWYKSYSFSCNDECRVPDYLFSSNLNDARFIALEDLDAAGFPLQKTSIGKADVKQCIQWLANFHATYLSAEPIGLWDIGTYWHLATRQEEWKRMEVGILREKADQIDGRLNTAVYQTFVHGDAKLANFCFSESGEVAAVDFQYVGGGCGMKDLAYFLGSCLSSSACFELEIELLDHYFSTLKTALEERNSTCNFQELEREWRSLYPFAWADFSRFLKGWVPGHDKLNEYSQCMTEKALNQLL